MMSFGVISEFFLTFSFLTKQLRPYRMLFIRILNTLCGRCLPLFLTSLALNPFLGFGNPHIMMPGGNSTTVQCSIWICFLCPQHEPVCWTRPIHAPTWTLIQEGMRWGWGNEDITWILWLLNSKYWIWILKGPEYLWILAEAQRTKPRVQVEWHQWQCPVLVRGTV